MGPIQCLLLLAAATSSGETTLLQFTSEQCKYCRQMEPTIARLKSAGYPVREIDVERSRPWAEHYQVTGVPAFVMVSDGKVVGRINGFTSHARLLQLYEDANFSIQKTASEPRTQRPIDVRQVSHTTTSADRKMSAEQVAGQATVRLKIEDATGYSFGTGTIIDVHGDDALVLTCGHLFRTSGGKGVISVDLFAGSSPSSVPGKLVYYEADRADIGFVTIQLSQKIVPAPIAPLGFRVAKGDHVFNIGCNSGRSPTLRRSKVTSINRYKGPSNIEVAGMPVNGRSGGGLFTADGMLIGVCNAADDEDDEGIYAALPIIHEKLAVIGQDRISTRAQEYFVHADEAKRSQDESPSTMRLDDRLSAPIPPPRSLRIAENRTGAELIVVVRNADGTTETVVIKNPSGELLRQIRSGQQSDDNRQAIDANDFANRFRTDWPDDLGKGPVLRGQSRD